MRCPAACRPQVLRYDESQKYDAHHDFFNPSLYKVVVTFTTSCAKSRSSFECELISSVHIVREISSFFSLFM